MNLIHKDLSEKALFLIDQLENENAYLKQRLKIKNEEILNHIT
jgi:hypothetical protein